jgi:hypothetical protein
MTHVALKALLLGGRHLRGRGSCRPAARFAAETKAASHEVMELVRKDPALSLFVIQLREAGQPWRQVKPAIETEIKRARSRHLRRRLEE